MNRYSIESDKQIFPIGYGTGERLIDRDIVSLRIVSTFAVTYECECVTAPAQTSYTVYSRRIKISLQKYVILSRVKLSVTFAVFYRNCISQNISFPFPSDGASLVHGNSSSRVQRGVWFESCIER